MPLKASPRRECCNDILINNVQASTRMRITQGSDAADYKARTRLHYGNEPRAAYNRLIEEPDR